MIAGRGWQPAVAIDAGPYDAVIVCWSGRCVTVLGGPRQPVEKKDRGLRYAWLNRVLGVWGRRL